jgi:hypothetical protein
MRAGRIASFDRNDPSATARELEAIISKQKSQNDVKWGENFG